MVRSKTELLWFWHSASQHQCARRTDRIRRAVIKYFVFMPNVSSPKTKKPVMCNSLSVLDQLSHINDRFDPSTDRLDSYVRSDYEAAR